MATSPEGLRSTPELTYVASVALRLDDALSAGETPDGVQMQFAVHGTVDGPSLKGEFRKGTLAYLRIDRDGVGTINVRAPLMLQDGARLELEATGRYDFGEDGFSRAKQGPEHLPDSDLGWCPRIITSDSRYLWLNRTQFLGVGKLVPSQTRVDYDLYAIGQPQGGAGRAAEAAPARVAGRASLYERLGRRPGIYRLMSASIDSLHHNEQLIRQNPRLAEFNAHTNIPDLKEKVTDLICRMAGGPCVYTGRPIKATHAPMNLTQADWRVFVEDTIRVMTELSIPATERNDLLALLEGTHADIVSRP